MKEYIDLLFENDDEPFFVELEDNGEDDEGLERMAWEVIKQNMDDISDVVFLNTFYSPDVAEDWGYDTF